MKANRPSRLNPDRVKLLTDIGFVWEASRRRLLDGGLAVAETDMDNNSLNNKRPAGRRTSDGMKTRKIRPTDAPRARKGDELESHDDKDRHEIPEAVPELPGRVGMVPAAPMGPTATFPQAVSTPGQGGAVQGNLGELWAAMAAGQGGFMRQEIQLPFLIQTATGASVNPALFIPMGAALMQLGAAMQAAPGMPFNPSHLASSMLQTGMTQQNPQCNNVMAPGMLQQNPQPQTPVQGMPMIQNVLQLQSMVTGMQPNPQTGTQQEIADGLQRNPQQGAVDAILLPNFPRQGMPARLLLSNQQQPSHVAAPPGDGQIVEATSESPNFAGDGGDHSIP
jgi:hypothetical protein